MMCTISVLNSAPDGDILLPVNSKILAMVMHGLFPENISVKISWSELLDFVWCRNHPLLVLETPKICTFSTVNSSILEVSLGYAQLNSDGWYLILGTSSHRTGPLQKTRKHKIGVEILSSIFHDFRKKNKKRKKKIIFLTFWETDAHNKTNARGSFETNN